MRPWEVFGTARLSPNMIRSNLARSRATAMSCQSSGRVHSDPLPVCGPDQPSRPNPAWGLNAQNHIQCIFQSAGGYSPEHLNHAEIPIVDWPIGMQLLSCYDEINLDQFARRSRYASAGLEDTDPAVVRMVLDDLGKSGSDGKGQDSYGDNPKYGGAVDNLCSEFALVSPRS